MVRTCWSILRWRKPASGTRTLNRRVLEAMGEVYSRMFFFASWIAQVTDLNWIRIKIKQRQLSAEVSVRYLVSTTELSAINLRIIGCASASKPSKSRSRRVAAGHLGCSCGGQRSHFHQQWSRSCRTGAKVRVLRCWSSENPKRS